jgi:hypothetical protein
MHGHHRVLGIVAEYSFKRKGVASVFELSGMFRQLTFGKCWAILRTGDVFLKCLGSYVGCEPEVTFIACHICDGVLCVSIPDNNCDRPLAFDLSKYE